MSEEDKKSLTESLVPKEEKEIKQSSATQMNIQCASSESISYVKRLVELICTEGTPALQIAAELSGENNFSESQVAVLLAFALSAGRGEAFDVVREVYSVIVDSICVGLKLDASRLSFDLLKDDIEGRTLLYNDVFQEFIKNSQTELAIQLLEKEKGRIVIFEDLLDQLARAGCTDVIDRLLSKNAYIILAVSQEENADHQKCKVGKDTAVPLEPLQALRHLLVSSEDAKVIPFIQTHRIEVNDATLELMAEHNRFPLIAHLDEYENPTQETLLYAIKFHSFSYLLTNYQYFLDYVSSGTAPRLLSRLIESCEDFEDIEVKIFLLKLARWYISQSQTDKIFHIFESAVDKLEERPNIFDFTHNPIKLSVLIIEMLMYMGQKYRLMHFHYMKIKGELVKYVSALSDSIKNEESLRLLFLEEDFEGREVLVVIEELRLYNVLQNKRMKILVKTLWDANYVLGGSLMAASHLYRLLLEWPLNSKVDVENQTRFQRREVQNIPQNELNFNVWKKGIGLRYMTQSIIYFILAVFFQVLIYQFLREGETFEENRQDVKEIAEQIYIDLGFFLKCSAIWFILPIKVLFDYLFRIKAKRNYPFFTNEFFVLFVQVVCTICLYVEFFRMSGQCEALRKEPFHVCFCREFFKEQPFFLKEALSIQMFCIWMRAIMSLSITQLIGPLVTTTIMLIKDLLRFLLLFGLINIAFGCFFSLLLVQIEEFRNPFKAIYTLYMASLLIFDPKILDSGDSRTRFYAYFFMLIYLFVSAVTLINLLLAVFTVTFTKAEEKAKALYLAKTISLRPVYKYDKRYSYYVSSAFPFTATLVVALPFLVFDLSSELINKVMLHIEYLPFMLCSLGCFFICNLFILPFAYLKVLLHKFLLICRRNKDTVASKLVSFLFYLPFGLIISMYQLVADCGVFIGHLYSGRLEKLFKDQREIERFEPAALKDMLGFFHSLREDLGHSEMTLDEAFARYEDNAKVRNVKVEGGAKQRDLEALKQVLHTVEYSRGSEKCIDINTAYCLLKSISKTWKYFELTKGGRRTQRKYARAHAVTNNINRRIVCQQDEIEDSESSNSK